MNLPNRLTTSRIILALALIFILPLPGIFSKIAALIIFSAASLTDYWDGRIARRSGAITPFGIFLDPIADKALTFSAFCGFIEIGVVPAWMVVLILVRDLSVTGLRLLLSNDLKKASSGKSGKHKTVIQFSAILLILAYLILRQTSFWRTEWDDLSLKLIYWFMLYVVGFTLYSGARYLYIHRQYLKGNFPSS